jgi:hypothetical protein
MSQTDRADLGNDRGTSLGPPRLAGRHGEERRVSIARGGPYRRWRGKMSEILVFGLVAIAVVVIMAGLLGRLVAHDDISSYVEG